MLAVVSQKWGDLYSFQDVVIYSKLSKCKPVYPVVLQIQYIYLNILFYYSIYTFYLTIYFQVVCDGARARHLLLCRFLGNLRQFAAICRFLGNLPNPAIFCQVAISSLTTSALITFYILLVSTSLLLLLSLVFLYSSNL